MAKMNEKMATVYLEVFSIDDICVAPIETLIVVFTIKYSDSPINITFVRAEKPPETHGYTVDIDEFTYNVLELCEIPTIAGACCLPNLSLTSSSCVAGLCACLRQIVKFSIVANPNHHCRDLLGFKDACLLACAESSVWTRFCEVELIAALKNFNEDQPDYAEIPGEIARFEGHMSKPIRLHNIYKYSMSKKFSPTGFVTQDRNAIPEHIYAESSSMTLADVIILVCIHIFLNIFPKNRAFELLPYTAKWYGRMIADAAITKCLDCILVEFPRINKPLDCYLPAVSIESMYRSDAKRENQKNLTRQEDIDNSLRIVKSMEIEDDLKSKDFPVNKIIDWSKIPWDATPEGGSLPSSRSERKYEQLKSLCNPVLQLATPNDVIVDFCSGSGHLGILVACLLPECTIILLENKEESLNRSKERVKKLNINNVKFFQCNLDYFKGNFDIGMSLHACGVATDLVVRHCIYRNAIFVSCPCCYGSIVNCHHINYPRSSIFKDRICLRDYLVLGHAADQTHDCKNAKTKQGYECMNIIDTDRKLQAQQFGYTVFLSKLTPETCTPKNNLLIGIPKYKKNL